MALGVGLREAGNRRLIGLAELVHGLGLATCSGVVAVHRHAVLAHPRLAVHVAALEALLFAIGEDDPVVVLGMLEIVLRQHWVAGRLGIPGERHVFFGHVGWGAADFHVRSIGLVAARKRVLPFALLVVIVVVIVVAATSATVLLSLPHGLQFSLSCLRKFSSVR